ncbi:MAG: ATP-binding cassette domain-containing protein [Anaerolineales bacterium]|nr:ATP-binding cassette domain-containing protein [Anaerolineales bacterium]
MSENNVYLKIEDVVKSFGEVQAVRGVSFQVHAGEIFGLLGPNGAGKTTLIRSALDIIKPTSGKIEILGGAMTEEKKSRIGYLPEERGLYDDMTLWDTLIYLGRLKGLTPKTARERSEKYLRELDLWEARERKIQALSRGMTQKAQFIAGVMHEPDLIIIDEPFSGLDPVNTRLIKQLLYRMRDRGAGIIMSTHQMVQVEEMCSRILLINQGEGVLYGDLDEIRSRFTTNAVEVDMEGEIDSVQGVEQLVPRNGGYHLVLGEGVQPEEVLQRLVSDPDLTVERYERVEISLDDIFVQVVGGEVLNGTEEEAV